ncbi:MAG: hypothetical protein ACM3MH_11850, partial [Actinomycetota bacterium]
HLDGATIEAPIDGRVRGIVRDSTRVPERAKLIEIDPRGRRSQWTGIDERGRASPSPRSRPSSDTRQRARDSRP